MVDERRGRVYVLQSGMPSQLSLIDARCGAVMRTLALAGSAAYLALDAATGLVVVAGTTAAGGSLQALDVASGRVSWRRPLEFRPAALVLDARRRRVLIAAEDTATVREVALADGAFVRDLTVGQDPQALAIDLAAGRAYAVSLGGVPEQSGILDRMQRALPSWLAGRRQPRVIEEAGSVTTIDTTR